ncbi:DUF4402 domain-containing protein [Salinimicrobium sediminilitoris]|uniref:DUF4402 domain-containing protein n=1 Tax=Salinimicrobium sediminilitoris TaxID=2876715 RepID=UPI001E633F42|nr:DUF4402 domain-containing protein [Salinimicrobium sediminilitoris]MCC8358639.1 DUF4402 domain-containing protein [Salinimicrobium sediminilitoris]
MTGKSYFIFMFLSLSSIVYSEVAAQENPPIPVTVEVRNAQGLNFGSFTVGTNGGNVFMSPNGNRTGDSDVHLLNVGQPSHYAIFDVYVNPGTLLQIQGVYDFPLEGPSGSDVTLTIDPNRDISTGQTFITTQNPHEVLVGGQLKIPNGSSGPAGSYNAMFTITFIHE